MKTTKNLQATIMLMFVFLSVLMLNSLSFGTVIEVIPLPSGAKFVEAVDVRDSNPNEIIFTTRNIGPHGSTPASAWKMTLDPVTGEVLSTVGHELSLTCTTQATIFESSSGTLFTGGGWLGTKPPYYSTDGGDTWLPANVGTYPYRSTYSYVEFDGDIYAGSGYLPLPGEVYRWLGGGSWEQVFAVPEPERNIVRALAEYDDSMFVSAEFYSAGGWEGTVPVYMSSDGVNFSATTGMPSSENVTQFIVADGQLLSLSRSKENLEYSLYLWNSTEWQYYAPYNFDEMISPFTNNSIAVSAAGVLYTTGRAPNDVSAGFYHSFDLGLTWEQFDLLDNYRVNSEDYLSAMHLYDDTLYVSFTPEPTTICMFSLGTLALMKRRRG